MTISYRGAGGYFIGDTIIFDGKNTVGNTTLLKISGPGLPSQGVPVYNLKWYPRIWKYCPSEPGQLVEICMVQCKHCGSRKISDCPLSHHCI